MAVNFCFAFYVKLQGNLEKMIYGAFMAAHLEGFNSRILQNCSLFRVIIVNISLNSFWWGLYGCDVTNIKQYWILLKFCFKTFLKLLKTTFSKQQQSDITHKHIPMSKSKFCFLYLRFYVLFHPFHKKRVVNIIFLHDCCFLRTIHSQQCREKQ